MTKLFILFNEKYLELIDSYLRTVKPSFKQLKIIVFNKALGKQLAEQHNVRWAHYEEYLDDNDLEEFNREAILWLHSWSQKKIAGNRSITEYFKFDQCSLWWISGYLYIYADLLNLISTIKIVNKIFDKENINQVVIPDVSGLTSTSTQLSLNDPNYSYKILYEICKQKEIDIKALQINFSDRLNWNKKILTDTVKKVFFEKAYIISAEIIRNFLARRNSKAITLFDLSKQNSQKIIFISPSRNWGKLFNLQSGNIISGDTKLGYLYQRLSQESDRGLLGIDANSIENGEFEILRQKLKSDEFIPWRSIESFVDGKTWLKARQVQAKFRKEGLRLLKFGSFRDSLKYEEVPLYKILEPRLKFLFRTLLPYGAAKKIYYDNFCNRVKPHIFIISYETGLHGRAAISAAQQFHVPVIAIQHGKIHRSHPQYIHLQVSPPDTPDFHYAPIADVTAVFGEQAADVLTKESSYPEKNVILSGQLSTDAILLADKLYDKKKFLKELNLNPANSTVCLLSQNFDSESDFHRFFKVACESLSEFPELNFIIKLHPRQNPHEIQQLIDKYYGIPGKAKVVKNVDLYETIFCSDIVVTGNSTVGLETMLFKKPLITIEGFKYSMGYAESGASIGVTSRSEMIATLESLLSDSAIQKTIVEKGQEYLKYYYYKIDGKVTERIEKIIDNLLKTKHEGNDND